jgi:hybrid cluster-associated redox disulfide protein
LRCLTVIAIYAEKSVNDYKIAQDILQFSGKNSILYARVLLIPKYKRKEAKAMTVTKDMMIGDILDADRALAKYFLEMGMHCLGCPSARSETLEQACEVHGVDANELLGKINSHLNQ